jgi:hypothetical protein
MLPTGEPAPEVFMLRRGEDSLSLFRSAISGIAKCKMAIRNPRGAATLHAGRVRAGNYPGQRKLDVIEAEGENTEIPGHAALTGLPDPIEAYGEAERVASLLRDQSRKIPIL